MPRRKKRNWTRWDAWIAKQETKKPADEQKLEVTGQEPADDLEVQVRGQGQADDLEVQVRGQEPADDLEVQVRGQADDLEVQVRGQEPADDQDVEVREQEPADSPEVVETGEWKEEFMFNPFTGNDQLELADQLNLSVERYLNIQERNVPLEAPISPIRIIGDGNCFYRAISYLICGTQDYHDVLRQRTVEYMSTLSEDVYRPWLAFEHPEKTMDQYLSRDGRSMQNRHPADLEAWATQVEINAMSSLLGRRIFVYGKHGFNVKWEWMKYPWCESNTSMLDGRNAIYMQHTNGNHFDVVTATVFNKRQTRSMSRRHREETTEASQVACIKRKTMLNANNDDDDRKRVRRDRERKRYQEDPEYAKAQRDGKKTRYSTDKQHAQEKRERERERALERYHTDDDYAKQKREREQERAQERYHTDDDYAQQKRDHEKDKYHTDPDRRDLKKRNVQINREKKQNLADVNKDIEQFQMECKEGPEYVCTVCHRLLFRNQVVICHRDGKKSRYVRAVKHCLTGTYVHQCNVDCSPHACPIAKSSRGKEWICHCCHRHMIDKKTIPYEAQSNKMKLPEIPPELKSLNTLESQLIAKRIPFMKVAALPKGGQKGVVGPVVCVPADVSETHAILPRMPSEAQLIKVKLKRKLQYSGHHMYRQISPLKVDVALKYLVENNEHYSGTSIDADWATSWNEEGDLVEPSDAEQGGNGALEVHTAPEHRESVTEEGDHMEGPTRNDMEDDETDNVIGQVNEEEAMEVAALSEEETVEEAALSKEETMEEAALSKEETVEEAALSEEETMEEAALSEEETVEEAALSKEETVEEAAMSEEETMEEAALSKEETVEEATLSEEETMEEAALSEEEELDSRLRGLPHDTCLQPVDIGQDFLDRHDERVMCVAPGEGNKPISVFQEVGGEAMSFPVQFPTGKFSFNVDRDVRITPSKYFKARLMGADTRFASDTNYIFFAQYVTELRFIQSNISISMRKGSPTTSGGRKISAGMLSNKEDLQAILKSDEGYRFLQPVRGTPQFWDKALNELYAMIRQLGIPTWFATFSAADLRWPEVLEAIRQDHGTVPVSDLSWEERCDILKSNPVTAARMFDRRVKLFFKHLIKSPSQPIGEVIDTFTRTEFQQRGSPHIHCLFWVKDAPKLGVNSEEEICSFVDRYVCCQLPNSETDKELFDIVSQVQMHRKGHTSSCKKGGKICRFGFPKPPVNQTFLCSPVSLQDLTDEESASIAGRKKQAESDLKKFWDVLDKKTEPEKCSTEDVLKEANLTTAQVCDALNLIANRKQVFLRREPKDMWVNNFNPHLLRAWNANMDIQYVLDAYSCVKYIVSYISKAEREMGKLLKQAQKEAREGNEDVLTEMRKVGNAYLHHREVSAQEAVYRVCSLNLKECSRQVTFIPTDEQANRLSKPLADIQKLASEGNGDEENIWMPSIMDRYKARPQEEPFRSMCAAEFVSEYRVVSCSGQQENAQQSSRGEAKHVLRDNYGAVQKRTRSDPAVIRFAKFNKKKEPERFYLTLLKLYLPHYLDAQLKPPQYAKYEEFYSNDFAPISDREDRVNVIVNGNRRKFEQNVEELEQARKDAEDGNIEDVWAQIFPEVEQERLDCLDKRGENEVDGVTEGTEDDIPDLATTDKSKERSFTLEACQTKIQYKTAVPMMQSLNPMQQGVFYFVRNWCMETAQGKRPDPFHIFVTGGAGTGKSHLIKCIYYEATRLLGKAQENPDKVSVLLTAPTGTAAFNIGGSTVHHAFHLMCVTKTYQPLSESTLNTLRAQYESLKIVIVDEVSMVDMKLMSSIHGRLGQLTQSRSSANFGNVSILAVGDMYQIPPVRGQSLYRGKDFIDLWNPIFEVVELEEIMRQKDDAAFANLLNRMRVKRKKDKLSDEDDKTLSSRVLSTDFASNDYPKDALHIFSINKAVVDYNDKMLNLRCSDVTCFEASDFVKDPTTGSMTRRPHAQGDKDDLLDVVKVGIGARVMLCRNVNVEDGLVNGAFGTVTGVTGGQQDGSDGATVFVKFDNPKAGVLEREKSAVPSSLPENSVPIRQVEDNLKKLSKVKRYQIPIKLAWACTVHKVQGMTVPEVVVSMKNIFASGMAYVALSRVCSIGGLHITDYKQESIYCDEAVQEAVNKMKHFEYVSNPFTNVGDRSVGEVLNIVHHNTEGLEKKFESLKSTCLVEADIICLTETWLSENVQSSQFQLESFNMFRKDRSSGHACEEASNATRTSSRGGVAIYVRDIYKSSEIPIPNDISLECVVTQVSADCMPVKHLIVAIYRPPNVRKDSFISSLEKLLGHLSAVERSNTVILGDFNENLMSSENKMILSFLMQNGFKQLIESPTTERCTLIDHVYISQLSAVVKHGVIQTFYSYHDAVYCTLCNER
ncbi:uncharacterized protein LOC144865469 isoform X1 [Branchiostoma floridae x Branchiostoma japonicum]